MNCNPKVFYPEIDPKTNQETGVIFGSEEYDILWELDGIACVLTYAVWTSDYHDDFKRRAYVVWLDMSKPWTEN